MLLYRMKVVRVENEVTSVLLVLGLCNHFGVMLIAVQAFVVKAFSWLSKHIETQNIFYERTLQFNIVVISKYHKAYYEKAASFTL